MFKFLKDKLKQAVKKFTKDVEEEAEEIKEEIKEIPPEKPTKIDEIKDVEEVLEEDKEEEKETEEEKEEVVEEEKEEEVSEEEKEVVEEEKIAEVEKIKEVSEEEKEEKPSKEEKTELPELPAESVEEEHLQEETEEEIEEEEKQVKKLEKELAQPKESLEEQEEQIQEELKDLPEKLPEEPKEKKGFLKKLFGKKEPEKLPEEPKEKKSILKTITERVTKIHLSDDKFESLFFDLEVSLLENNVAVEVIEKIKNDLKEELTTDRVSRKGVEEIILQTLRKSITEVLDQPTFNLLDAVNQNKPCIIAMIGVNGSGKTTTLAKFIKLLQDSGKTVVVAASDTFRAAAIQQLEEHTKRLGVKLIKQDYKSDPTAVAFDAVKHAESKKIDVVLIDTAGRLHVNTNLMDELKKLIRVNKPHLKIFVGESITGNDCVEQAKVYNDAIGIDGIVLSKADVDEKGGAAVSISYVTKKPILYLGTGQEYKDLKPFKKEEILKNLDL